MNNDMIERKLEQFGKSLRSRPPITDRILKQFSVAKRTEYDEAEVLVTGSAKPAIFNSRRFAVAASFVAAAFCIGIVLFMALSRPQVSWAQVAQAVQEQKWIRGTVEDKNGKRTVWVSPKNKTWAFEFDSVKIFCDQNEKAKYEYSVREKTITKLPLGNEVIEKVLPVNALSQSKQAIEPWLFGTEKVISQKRQIVTEKGKTWIEFEMVMFRGSRRHATLRVDPKTKLLVRILFSSKDKTEVSTWHFDYPQSGPEDIYALNVAKSAKVVDLIPDPKTQKLLETLRQNRNKIDDFRMVVALSADRRALVVWKKGKKWRVDSCYWDKSALLPDLEHGDWFAGNLPGVHKAPLYVSDGNVVWHNRNDRPGQKISWQQSEHVGPQDLMSGEGMGTLSAAPYTKLASLLYPSIEPRKGWRLSVDHDPKGHTGKILIKMSTELAGGKSFGHNWYYLNPANGHAVERIDLMTSKDGKVDELKDATNWQTITMQDFFKSKNGVWLCRKVIYPDFRTKVATAKYHFDFSTKLDDKLFKLPK
jgi:hypothetical protein